MTRKETRLAVWNKYNGHCAYCGRPIAFNEMQVDHKHPKHLSNWVRSEDMRKLYEIDPDINGINNLMPSCRRCNHYKRGELLETFREMMKTIHERIRKNYICKVAEDYGIIVMHPFDGKFYYEKVTSDKHLNA